MEKLNSQEIEILEVLAGRREPVPRPWAALCLFFLVTIGYCSGDFQPTPEGLAALEESQADVIDRRTQ